MQNYLWQFSPKKSCLKAIEYYFFAFDQIWEDEANWSKEI